ncbi:hypothetical protein [Nonomuraea dietziae]|uniref:hypothetical protein n=1 Tax=Nonomuraea dietziae TaxID=65515 RepID=UPI0033E68140
MAGFIGGGGISWFSHGSGRVADSVGAYEIVAADEGVDQVECRRTPGVPAAASRSQFLSFDYVTALTQHSRQR